MDDTDTDTDEYEDDVTRAFLGESTYERLRFSRYTLFSQSIPRKLRLQSTLLFGLAAVLPIMAAFPAEVRESVAAKGVGAASPKVILLGLIGGVVVFFGGLALAAVAVARVHLEPRMSEYEAQTLLSLEETASVLGFGTGGVPIILTLGYVLLGHGGVGAIEAYIRNVGASPYAASGVGISVATVAASAFVGGVALFVLGQAVHMELRLRLEYAVEGA
jgi:hypothetical protein